MSDEIIKTLIVTSGIVFIVMFIGLLIVVNEWRSRTGRNSLESSRRELEARKMNDAYRAEQARLAGKT